MVHEPRQPQDRVTPLAQLLRELLERRHDHDRPPAQPQSLFRELHRVVPSQPVRRGSDRVFQVITEDRVESPVATEQEAGSPQTQSGRAPRGVGLLWDRPAHSGRGPRRDRRG